MGELLRLPAHCMVHNVILYRNLSNGYFSCMIYALLKTNPTVLRKNCFYDCWYFLKLLIFFMDEVL
jgi:hypothetical protein